MFTSTELRIAVCDDQPADLEKIAEMTVKILDESKIAYTLDKYETGIALLTDVQNGKKLHVLLLDVVMDGLDGMQIAAELRRQDNKASVVFVSANRDMALYGYRVNAARYLAKPLDAEELKEALLYCHRLWQGKREILLSTDQGKRRIPFSDIQFAEAFDRGTKVFLKEETLDVRRKFSEFETMLPRPDFLLCHRGFVINLSCVKYIHQYEFVLKSGLTVPVGKARYTEIKNRFAEYLTN